jgi:hypothetical protein
VGRIGILDWIATWPLRKPLALLVSLAALGAVLYSLRWSQDIPTEAADILKTLVMVCVGGYIGSSSYESARRLRETEVPHDEGEDS